MDDKRILDAVRSPADLKLLSDEDWPYWRARYARRSSR